MVVGPVYSGRREDEMDSLLPRRDEPRGRVEAVAREHIDTQNTAPTLQERWVQLRRNAFVLGVTLVRTPFLLLALPVEFVATAIRTLSVAFSHLADTLYALGGLRTQVLPQRTEMELASIPTPRSIPSVPTAPPADVLAVGSSSSTSVILNETWYVTWTAQVGTPPPIPEGVSRVNVFVGQLDPVQGVSGLQGAFATEGVLQDFVTRCKAAGIDVVVSIGGNGGSYDNTWDQLTEDNVSTFASALTTFCQNNGLAGIDFDWEPTTQTQAQGILVGNLIQQFKTLSNLSTSLCVNSAPTWQTNASWVFSQAISCIDRLNIMAYYPATMMEPYIGGQGLPSGQIGWKQWLMLNSPSTQIVVGMLSTAPDLSSFSSWDYAQNFSTSTWFWDPSNPSSSNAATTLIWNQYHPAATEENPWG